jgi:hypothetical protein
LFEGGSTRSDVSDAGVLGGVEDTPHLATVDRNRSAFRLFRVFRFNAGMSSAEYSSQATTTEVPSARSADENCMFVARVVSSGLLFALAASLHASAPGPEASSPHRSRECTPQFAPLTTGSSNSRSHLKFWRKSEGGQWGGDGWLGWTYDDDALVPVTLIVRAWTKERPDDEDEVTVESLPDVSFAMRCIGVPTAHIRSAGVVNHELHNHGPLRMSLGEREYSLALRGSREDLTDAQVVLSDGHRSQRLYSTDGFVDDPHFNVPWAGDLDGDGELDLVVNLSRKYSVHPYLLLLSSVASNGELVGEAARFETGD